MSIHFNQKAYKVTSADIQSITLYNVTMTKNLDENNGFVFEGYHTTAGCGTEQDSGVLILLKDSISWTKICFKWEGSGTASCWSFMNTSGSNHGTSTGTPSGNLLDYNESLGDRVHDNFLTWEVSAYQTHNKVHACDNDADNFFRFNGSQFKKLRMTRRRNVGAGLAGIHHGRSCNSKGSTEITRISEIFIW